MLSSDILTEFRERSDEIRVMSYDKDEKNFFRMTPTIKFEDASGRKYKQNFCIDIGDRLGNGIIINYAQPELCEE